MEEMIEKEEKVGAFSLKDFLINYIKFTPWLILSAAFFVTLAYLRLRYTTNIFEVRSKMMIKSENQFGKNDKFEDMFTNTESQNLNDEIEILKSTGISKRIAQALGLQLRY